MITISFTEADLISTRVLEMPDPALETALSLSVLRGGAVPRDLDQWRRRVRRRLPPSARALIELPTLDCGLGPLEVIEALLPLNRPFERLAAATHAARPPARLMELLRAVQSYFGIAVAPMLPQITASVRKDFESRARNMLAHGIERLLGSLDPRVRWKVPQLLMPCCGDQHLPLGGSGLLLVPSFFCWRQPVLVRAGAKPVVAYPVNRTAAAADGLAGAPRQADDLSLETLLGRTRAAILRAVRDSPNTSELGDRANVSVSTASEHACVLRNAGLISSDRHRNQMVHTLTPLGEALLDGRGYLG